MLQKGCRGVHLCRISVVNRGVKVKSWKSVKTKRRQWLKLQARLAWYAKLSHWAQSCLVSVILCCLRGSGVILHFTKKAKTSNSAMSTSFMSSLRGGAVSDETSTFCIECSNSSSARGSGSTPASCLDVVSGMPDMIRPLSQGGVQGDIDGVSHISAWTCGDGSCGLHALFGLASSGQMYASGIREIFASQLKDDLSSMMASLPSQGSKALLTEVLNNVWRELKDVADVLSQQGIPEIDGNTVLFSMQESLTRNNTFFEPLIEEETI